jgi:flagellar P-ring protein FlgI
MRRWIVISIGVLALATLNAHASKTLREIARIKGQGASVVQGLGLVVGLQGTGDSGSELAMARPLAEALKKLGNPVSVDDLSSTKSVALVMVTCEIPRDGAKVDDRILVNISVLNSAKSLVGGRLLISPLIARPGTPVYAFAQGPLTIPDKDSPTVARIARGAQIVRDINTTPSISGSFDLIIDPFFSGYAAAASIASEINQQYLLSVNRLNQSIAEPVDARTIRVIVPLTERTNPASFFGDIMQTDISSALRKLPAKVICDSLAGTIVVTGDVQVSQAIINHNDMSISTTVAIPADPNDPNASSASNNADTSELEDLLLAFGQLDIPPIEQINILRMLFESGKLHARLIIDGQE